MMVPVAGQARIQESAVSPLTMQQPAARPYKHIVVLGDPHLPGPNLAAKEKVIQTVNSWPDVDSVVALGDLCDDVGTSLEIEQARRFFGKLRKPLTVIHGNHDYMYRDERDASGNRIKGPPEMRAYKLKRFRETFGLVSSYYSQQAEGYLLLFLSADDLHADSATWMSTAQLDWWQAEMAAHRDMPTIVFCHAPLHGTVSIVRESVSVLSGSVGALLLGGMEWALPTAIAGDLLVRRFEKKQMAQPCDRIRQIVLENPQLFLWLSGHFHVTATNRTFNSLENVFKKQVTLIHNAAMNGRGYHSPWSSWQHNTIWTNSLYLYPDWVSVRTYDHTSGCWLKKLDRTVKHS